MHVICVSVTFRSQKIMKNKSSGDVYIVITLTPVREAHVYMQRIDFGE